MKNHLRNLWFVKNEAEADVGLAASALEAKAEAYARTRERGDWVALRQAVSDFDEKAENLEWQRTKMLRIKEGWLTMDSEGSRVLSEEEQRAATRFFQEHTTATDNQFEWTENWSSRFVSQ